MGGLAALAREAGHTVTGCDAGVYPPMSDQLRALGIDLVEGYGAMLNDLGQTFQEALSALDSMHARVALLYPELKPPTFRVTDVTPGSLSLHYFSHRPGLGQVVHGLVEGLATRFGIEIDIVQAFTKDDEHDHDRFDIRILGPLAHAA